MKSEGVVRQIIFVTGGWGWGERIRKVTAVKFHRQCPPVLLVKIILEAWWGIVESRRWSDKNVDCV
jgi:hypothetical protein